MWTTRLTLGFALVTLSVDGAVPGSTLLLEGNSGNAKGRAGLEFYPHLSDTTRRTCCQAAPHHPRPPETPDFALGSDFDPDWLQARSEGGRGLPGQN